MEETVQLKDEPICEQGLRFFSATTASLSHELKNALAIIKENAGLLTDYMAMFEKGSPVAPDRLITVARRIEDQVSRADNLIKSMNQYAHTVDNLNQTVDMNDILGLFVLITQRFVAQHQVTLEVIPSSPPASMATAPFFLLTLLRQYLEYIVKFVRPGDHLLLGNTTNNENSIYFKFPQGKCESSMAFTPSAEQAALQSFLMIDVVDESNDGRITIQFKPI